MRIRSGAASVSVAVRMHACLGPAAAALLVPAAVMSAPTDLQLPTENDALLRGDLPAFYMHVDRTFEGERSTPWQGGQFGYVRNPKRSGIGLVYTRFHEGLDIRPARRDARGEPLDDVRAVSAGKVVHASDEAGKSSYGKYVVVEHDWESGPIYSLYAHLKSVAVSAGERVAAGETLGQLGYTGAGINRERAHVHFEFGLLLNEDFADWHRAHYTAPNHHGIYNGLNLTGFNPADFFLAHRRDPSLTVPEFIGRLETHFRVLIPRTDRFDLIDRYPWLAGDAAGTDPPSWEISFSAAGLPIRAEPASRRAAHPELLWVKPASVDQSWLTRGRIRGSGSSARLSPGGNAYLQLIAGTF